MDQPTWQGHVESEGHCAAMIQKYYSLRYDTYVTLYGDVPYSHTLDLPLDGVAEGEMKERLLNLDVKMVCRSGVLLAFECKVRL